MTLPLSSVDPTYRIYLTLAQYPMLRRRIRIKMRQESRKALLSAVARRSKLRRSNLPVDLLAMPK